MSSAMVTWSAEPAPAVLLVADDLTGAADAAAPFVSVGLSAVVLTGASPAAAAVASPDARERTLALAADVRAVSTNSRDTRDADAARDAVRAGVKALGCVAADADCVRFKKIDSTLRGHTAAETIAAMAAWSCARVVVAPAFPEMGRTLADGRLRIHDVASEISASELFEREALSSVITVSEPAAGTDLLANLARATAASDRLALICDTTHAATLDRIVDALWDRRADTLWAGSAGLARALARRAGAAAIGGDDHASAHDARAHHQSARAAGCVWFIGSLHETTMKQCAAIEAAGELQVMVTEEGQTQAVHALARGRDVLVRLRDDPPAALASMVSAVAAASPAGVILSGGDSALRVCDAAGVTAIRVLGEVETGVPWGACMGGALDGVPVVLKSGGFGQADALLRAARFLTRREEAR